MLLDFNKKWKKFELETKKSRFISFGFKIKSIDEFEGLFNSLKREYKKATHICYSYYLVENNMQKIKYFDDGEPKSSAGLPILNVIKNNNLSNVVIFVIRYFGGIKLGTGSLFRSYLKSAAGVVGILNDIF